MSNSRLQELSITQNFTEQLPADNKVDSTPRNVLQACYSWQTPKKFSQPCLRSVSKEAAALIGLTNESDWQNPEFTQVFSGQKILADMKPYACCYGGHQFGHWAGQLGDGRAINLGEVQTATGHWSLQLKGAGPTPYSRTADGLAVLRSSIREFICSEAMYHLNVPTTRALSLITTGESVQRDMFYSGKPQWEPGAIVCRMAASFIRFGSFEIFAARRDYHSLQQLMDYCIEYEFPQLIEVWQKDRVAAYIAWFEQVCDSTIDMIIGWMRVGFVHGVMNTDNMSIHGLTIDYGPYGWLDNYDPEWTPNTTDQQGRYRYANQAGIAQWNLLQLANAIYPLIKNSKPLEKTLNSFQDIFLKRHQKMLMDKLGLIDIGRKEDKELLEKTNRLLKNCQLDMTLFYRQLSHFDLENPLSIKEQAAWFEVLSYQQQITGKNLSTQQLQAACTWWQQYLDRCEIQKDHLKPEQRRKIMSANNPAIIPRNYLTQQVIELAEQDDYSELEALMKAIQKPYQDLPEHKRFSNKRPEWALKKPGCSSLSCSS